ncbi:hypothetical protein J4477_02680 [Candidatus Pacearchaeota archaeon]|nr:hypothetical protein [Candidatus Pacearchaeota archaeon]
MTRAGLMWECECGKTEYGEKSPEECKKCGRIDSFVQLPEEIAEEREKDMVYEEDMGDYDE